MADILNISGEACRRICTTWRDFVVEALLPEGTVTALRREIIDHYGNRRNRIGDIRLIAKILIERTGFNLNSRNNYNADIAGTVRESFNGYDKQKRLWISSQQQLEERISLSTIINCENTDFHNIDVGTRRTVAAAMIDMIENYNLDAQIRTKYWTRLNSELRENAEAARIPGILRSRDWKSELNDAIAKDNREKNWKYRTAKKELLREIISELGGVLSEDDFISYSKCSSDGCFGYTIDNGRLEKNNLWLCGNNDFHDLKIFKINKQKYKKEDFKANNNHDFRSSNPDKEDEDKRGIKIPLNEENGTLTEVLYKKVDFKPHLWKTVDFDRGEIIDNPEYKE